MSMTDPLGDMLARIRNAQMRKKTICHTKLEVASFGRTRKQGYIRSYEIRKGCSGTDIIKVALNILMESQLLKNSNGITQVVGFI